MTDPGREAPRGEHARVTIGKLEHSDLELVDPDELLPKRVEAVACKMSESYGTVRPRC